MKVYIWPEFGDKDEGDGGVRRVVELQRCHLPRIGIEVIDNPADADILTAHITMPDTFLSRYQDKPLVVHCHGLYWSEYDWVHNWYFKANAQVMEAIRQADAVTAPSEWVAQAIRRHTLRDVDVVNHGVDATEWTHRKGKGYVLWNKTRPDPICQPEDVNELARRMPDVRFITTFGDETLRNMIITKPVSHDKAKALIEEAGVYLCTTRETFGIGTLEALAAGVPIVGWAWGGQEEFLRHGEESWLTMPGDFDGLVEGVDWALKNRDKIAPKARELASRFTPEKVARDYGRVYERVLAGAHTRAKHPKTSIVVTAYDLEAHLEECLDSIAKQTSQDWECIIVDDASPDDCGKIADEYATKNSRFKVIHNRENQYLSRARNTGIAAAKGEYILPLDADDLLTPATVELLSKALDGDRSIHIAYGNVEFMDPDGRLWHSGWPVEFRYEWQLSPPPKDGRSPNLLPYCSMFRKTVWEQTGGYRTRCRTAEDADFWCRAASYGFRPMMVTRADTLRYRNRNDSMSRVEATWDWAAWFPWAEDRQLSPAGALMSEQVLVPSLDPPSVAFIIPVGPGHQDLMWDALDSVAAQTFRNWECIVVNDTGGNLPKLPSWVNLIRTGKKPVGIGAARNKGLEVAKASFFVPLDADDYLQPKFLESVVAANEGHQGIVYTDWYGDFGEGKVEIWQTPDYDPQLLITNGCLHAITALYPLSLWKNSGGFPEGQEIGWEDWDLQLSAAAKGICSRRVAAPLWTYRKYTGKRREETQAAFDRAKEQILQKWGEYWEGGKELMACGGCRKGKSTTQGAPQSIGNRRGTSPVMPQDREVVMVRYIGDKEGAVTFRGASGNTYRFSKNDPLKYVLLGDEGVFENRRDFEQAVVPGKGGLPDGKRLEAISRAKETVLA